ncbi:hypothetical protein OKW43_005913 [Paraburkholderia sp. WC7.3g]|nr:hypothetical protein [Paraburkholderia podalyriae]
MDQAVREKADVFDGLIWHSTIGRPAISPICIEVLRERDGSFEPLLIPK